MRNFETALNGPYYMHQELGYKPFVDIPSFVDYLIINEMTKNIDAYIFSTYFYKDRDSKGGKLHMGPAWDFNISFGNVDYNDLAMQTYGWLYDEHYRIYWFRRMMNDRVFSNYLNCRWHELRATVFSSDRIFGYIDSLVIELKEPIAKNFKKWPVLGTYVWPNVFIGNTHEEEITELKSWLKARLDWMDDHIPVECVTGIGAPDDVGGWVRVFPNPFIEGVRFEAEGKYRIVQIKIFDKEGRMIENLMEGIDFNHGDRVEWKGRNRRDLHEGLYIAMIGMEDGRWIYKKLMKN